MCKKNKMFKNYNCFLVSLCSGSLGNVCCEVKLVNMAECTVQHPWKKQKQDSMLQKQKERRKKRTHVTQNSLASSLHYAEVLFNHVILTSVLELQTIITQTNQAEGLPSPLHQQWSTTVLCSYIYVWSLTVSVAQSSCCCYCCHETSCSASLHRPLT